MFLFEKLTVYQKSLDFTHHITLITEQFSKGNGYIIDQLQRAALSIPLNIAEGNGRHHLKERCNFFWIARGSAFECVPILDLCFRKGLIGEQAHNQMREELAEIARMLSGLIEYSRK